MKNELIIKKDLKLTEENFNKLAEVNYKYDDLTQEIKRNLNSIFDNFIDIARRLHEVKELQLYKLVGYADIYDYANAEFEFGKTSVKNFIQIADKACVEDEDNNNLRISTLKEEYKNYGYSQLIELISLDKLELEKYNPEMSVREIKKNKFIDKLKILYNQLVDLENENNKFNEALSYLKSRFPDHNIETTFRTLGSYSDGVRCNFIVNGTERIYNNLIIEFQNNYFGYGIIYRINYTEYETFDELLDELEKNINETIESLENEKENEDSQTFDEEETIKVLEEDIILTGTVRDFAEGLEFETNKEFINRFTHVFQDYYFEWSEREEVKIYLDDFKYLAFNYAFGDAYTYKYNASSYFAHKFTVKLYEVESDTLIREFNLFDLFEFILEHVKNNE